VADAPAHRPVCLLAADTRREAVLVERTADRTLRLPLLGRIGEFETHQPIAALVAAYLGHPQAVLRVVPVMAGPRGKATDILVVVEPLAPPDAGAGTWTPTDDPRLDALRAAAGVGPHVSRWLDELATGAVDARRQRWEQPGFQDRARAWMRRQLEAAGTPAIAEPTVERLWPISAMLRVETTGGAAFMKACARVFHAEPAATAGLHRAATASVPDVVAIDIAEGWLLMRDAGGVSLGDESPDWWAGALSVLASIQQATDDGLDGVVLEDRGPAALAASLGALLDSPYVAGFPDDIGPRFRAAAPRLLDACNRLASLAPGPTVLHGDFHPWNVLRSGER